MYLAKRGRYSDEYVAQKGRSGRGRGGWYDSSSISNVTAVDESKKRGKRKTGRQGFIASST